jgi:hypothetical protein
VDERIAQRPQWRGVFGGGSESASHLARPQLLCRRFGQEKLLPHEPNDRALLRVIPGGKNIRTSEASPVKSGDRQPVRQAPVVP